MKKGVLILLVLLNTLPLAGCWDRTEINDIAIVVGLGIDRKDEKTIRLTAEINIPKALGGAGGGGGGGGGGGSGGGRFQTLIRSGEGNTIADAISSLQLKIPRKVFWGQTKVIVLGEKYAKEGIRPSLDFLTRHPEPRLRAHMFVAEGEAREVMALQPPLERSSSEVLRELALSKDMMDVTLKQLLQMLHGESQAAAIPVIRILPPQKGMESLQTIAYIHKTALFKKDKMAGQINEKLTRGVLWMRNEMKQANVSLQPSEGTGYVSMMLLRASSRLIPRIKDGIWSITVQAETEDDVIVNESNLNLTNPEIIRKLQQDLKMDIEHRLTETLDTVQKEMKIDILGFSEKFHHKYPKKWNKVKEDWDDIFPEVKVTYDIKAYIRRPGLTTTPQGVPEKEVKEK